ncbi:MULTISPECIES: lipoprotein YvcA [unclassified Bacillus (in: firmicutes)]|uniref:lipoprotein YvcA n=1 Tax=unclassified Bacillus (in: firmicutes) TaxID=185979 RepID=UPI0025B3076B|nr:MULTISPECIES: lipoprotein YvcA [unclassified Bacillus (in: firmicutes)]MDN0192174.1 lipoprotein YvcA [Bacillus sp. B.PNR1]MDN3033080.1 lipoprotein YvcA [Bacillus sp. B.PNR2]
MKKIIFICFSLLLALTGGCSMNDNDKNSTNDNKTEAVKPKDMDPKDLPQVPAFQDEKTREYMVSTKEQEPGYYLLESKLKGFRMLFPEDGEYSDSETSKTNESLFFDSINNKTNIVMNASLKFYQNESFINNPETMLDIVSGKNEYKGKFEKIEAKDKDIYFAPKQENFDNQESPSYIYLGYIKSKKQDYLGMEYSFMFSCSANVQTCKQNPKGYEKKVKKILNSVTFNLEEREDGK